MSATLSDVRRIPPNPHAQPVECFETDRGIVITELSTRRFFIEDGLIVEESLRIADPNTWTRGRTWPADQVEIWFPKPEAA